MNDNQLDESKNDKNLVDSYESSYFSKINKEMSKSKYKWK